MADKEEASDLVGEKKDNLQYGLVTSLKICKNQSERPDTGSEKCIILLLIMYNKYYFPSAYLGFWFDLIFYVIWQQVRGQTPKMKSKELSVDRPLRQDKGPKTFLLQIKFFFFFGFAYFNICDFSNSMTKVGINCICGTGCL